MEMNCHNKTNNNKVLLFQLDLITDTCETDWSLGSSLLSSVVYLATVTGVRTAGRSRRPMQLSALPCVLHAPHLMVLDMILIFCETDKL